jgi:hypothetical protein
MSALGDGLLDDFLDLLLLAVVTIRVHRSAGQPDAAALNRAVAPKADVFGG